MSGAAPVPTNGNSISPLARAVRRLVLLDRARIALGGAERLADVLGIGRRAINHKLAGDRALDPTEALAVADALEAHAAGIVELARNLRLVAGDEAAA